MSLPQASLHESTRARLLQSGGLRKHLLVLGLITGCGANHAIWSHAQDVQEEAAEHKLRAAIEAENGIELSYFSYMQRARENDAGQGDFLPCNR